MVKTVTREDLRREMEGLLVRHEMSFDEFVEAGRAGKLEDKRLRYAWFVIGPAFK